MLRANSQSTTHTPQRPDNFARILRIRPTEGAADGLPLRRGG